MKTINLQLRKNKIRSQILHKLKTFNLVLIQSDRFYLEEQVFLRLNNRKIVNNLDKIKSKLRKISDPSVKVKILKGTGINTPLSIRGHGQLNIGKYVSIGKELKILTSNHLMSFPNMQVNLQNKLGFKPINGFSEQVTIDDCSWIGDRVTFLPGSSIGIGSVVGANSVVTKQFPPFQIIAGNPARIIRSRFSEPIIEQILEIRWWDWSEAKMKRNQLFFESDFTTLQSDTKLIDLIVN
jgi:virginiamycin A acetyltransferase